MPSGSVDVLSSQRCAICDGGFGLIRYYTWRTPLCSKVCRSLQSPPAE